MTRPTQQTYAELSSLLEPVRRETIMENVVGRIEQLLETGNLRPGSRLPPEPQLAEMLHVSRSSLREALKGLVFLGLIRARPGDGTYVTASPVRVMSRHFQLMMLLHEIKYLEIYELRKIIEPAAAALAARRATRSDIEKMQAALRGMRENAEKREDFMKYEIAFHEALAQASNNLAILTTMQMLYEAMEKGRRRVLYLIDDMQKHCDRHEQILTYIQRRNARLARRALLADLCYAEKLLLKDTRRRRRRGKSPGTPTRTRWVLGGKRV